MTGEEAVAFLLFAVVAAITPGPSNVMLTAAGASAGVLKGLPCLLGVTAGMGSMMFLVPLGLGSLVLSVPWALTVLRTETKFPITAELLNIQGGFVSQWNVVAAGAIVAAIPTAIVFFIFQKQFVSGLTLGSSK